VVPLVICADGLSGPAEAAEKTGIVSASADAKAVIHRRVELRQDGSIKSDAFESHVQPQVNVHECDIEIRRIAAECVFLIYEMQ
jgi:hypothetical protein